MLLIQLDPMWVTFIGQGSKFTATRKKMSLELSVRPRVRSLLSSFIIHQLAQRTCFVFYLRTFVNYFLPRDAVLAMY